MIECRFLTEKKRFESSLHLGCCDGVGQLVERWTQDPKTRGSQHMGLGKRKLTVACMHAQRLKQGQQISLTGLLPGT